MISGVRRTWGCVLICISCLFISVFTRVDADVLDEPCRSSGGIVTVTTLQLPIIRPLETVHQHVGPVLQ